jgi:hypothetical protein
VLEKTSRANRLRFMTISGEVDFFKIDGSYVAGGTLEDSYFVFRLSEDKKDIVVEPPSGERMLGYSDDLVEIWVDRAKKLALHFATKTECGLFEFEPPSGCLEDVWIEGLEQ